MRIAPVIFLVLGILGIGASGVIAHYALLQVNPIELAALRMGISALFFLLIGRVKYQQDISERLQPVEIGRLAVAGVLLALHFIVWFTSLRMTSVTIATLLVCTTPLWTALSQALLKRTKVGLGFWGALLVSTIGLILILNPHSSPSNVQFIGDLLALSGGIVFAGYLLAIDGLQHHSSVRIVSWTYSIAAVLLWLIVPVTRHSNFEFSTFTWFVVLLLALVPQIIGHTSLNHALNFFPSHIVSITVLTEPVIAGILAMILLHEPITAMMVVGGLLVLSSIGYVLVLEDRIQANSAIIEVM